MAKCLSLNLRRLSGLQMAPSNAPKGSAGPFAVTIAAASGIIAPMVRSLLGMVPLTRLNSTSWKILQRRLLAERRCCAKGRFTPACDPVRSQLTAPLELDRTAGLSTGVPQLAALGDRPESAGVPWCCAVIRSETDSSSTGLRIPGAGWWQPVEKGGHRLLAGCRGIHTGTCARDGCL